MSGKACLGVVAVLVGLSGCIKTTTGGLPPPKSDAKRVDAQLDLARGYLENGDLARARGPLATALDIDPDSIEAHVLYAVLYERENEPEVAEYHYKKALRTDNRNSQALNNYGGFLYRQNRYDDAVLVLRKLVEDTEYHLRAQAFENLGLAELRAGHPDKAEEAFNRAVVLNDTQPRSYLELADLALSGGRVDEASLLYAKFRQLARQSARSLCLGMRIGVARDDGDEVASYGMALRNLYPDAAGQCQVHN
jgi:type IV pilus assembly protein PilF